MYLNEIRDKFKESLQAVLPIIAIVLILSFSIAPMPTDVLLSFLIGGLLLICGMMFFSMGAGIAMEPMGEKMGTFATKTKRVWLFILLGFILGFIITVSEPDLQVLAEQVYSIPNLTLILSVSVGVGFFLVVAILRMLFSIPLRYVLIGSYLLLFILCIFAPSNFFAIAFDAGGVTTGPMTVPFIMSFGIGIAAIRSDRHAEDDTFGLISLCSVGPILSVLVLSMIYKPENAEYNVAITKSFAHSVELAGHFVENIPIYLLEMAKSLFPIVVVFFLFQLIGMKMEKKIILKILVGILYTYIGLVLFLTGANVGFMPAGSYLGSVIASRPFKYILIPVGMLIGYFIVKAEPAVYVLMKQVEEMTNGTIKGKSLQMALSIGVSASVGLAMLRVLTGISIMWLIIPGYAVALLMAYFSPKVFVAVAFDSGGVASGPMTATFLLPLAVGACAALGGNVVTDAFGVVAMVAMTPIITIQALGLIYKYKSKTMPAHLGQINEEMLNEEYVIIDL